MLSIEQQERLKGLIAGAPLRELAAEVCAYRDALLAGGIGEDLAGELTAFMHSHLVCAVFESEEDKPKRVSVQIVDIEDDGEIEEIVADDETEEDEE